MTEHFARPVARLRDGRDRVRGAGFLVGDRHVVTCAHVVDDALNRDRGTQDRPAKTIRLDLPFHAREPVEGTVVAWFPYRDDDTLIDDPVADIAVLALNAPSSGGVAPERARKTADLGEQGFVTFGFPDGFDKGTEASGVLLSADAGQWLQVRDTQSHGHFIKAGFSGAPVFLKQTLELIGMVGAVDRDTSRRLGFVIPMEVLERAWPLLARPYKGLSAFTEDDAALFFGREAVTEEIRRKVDRKPFVTVVGPSGSGKSSVVMAGLVPALRRSGSWAIASCRPGRSPLYELAYGLVPLIEPDASTPASIMKVAEDWHDRLSTDPARILQVAEAVTRAHPRIDRLLIVIDQLEELFTLHDPARNQDEAGAEGPPTTDWQRAFIAVLAAIGAQAMQPAPPVQAVTTLRADFVGRALEHRQVADLLRDADVKLGPMTDAELADAVARPAARYGVDFEDGLRDRIFAAVHGQAGSLPLLEFALDRLWRRQQDGRLTKDAYEAIGGVEGALADHAEETFRSLGETDQDRLRRVMGRLVRLARPGEQGEDTRAVATQAEIGETDWALVPALADARLVVTGRDPGSQAETVEVIHEALTRSSPRLRGWLDADREFGLWRQRLGHDLDRYAEDDPDTLLRGSVLGEAKGWLDTRGHDLNARERRFIAASVDARRREEEKKEQDRRERERSNGRWLRRVTAALAIALIALAGAAWFALEARLERDRAEEARGIALARQLAGQAQELALLSRGSEWAESAAALAVESWGLLRSATAHEAARTSVRNLPIARIEHNDAVSQIAFSPDGALLATASGDGTARLVHTADGSELARVEHDHGIRGIVFSPNGQLLATRSRDGTACLVRTADGSQLACVEHDDDVWQIAFSPDGALLATASGDGTARLVHTADGSEFARVEHDDDVWQIAFSPDGALLATRSRDGTARLVNTADGTEIARVEHDDTVWEIAFGPDGALLATASGDGTVRLVRTADGTEIARVEHDDTVWQIAFSPIRPLLATGSADGTVRLLHTVDGTELARVEHDSSISQIAFSPNGPLLATRSRDGTVRLVRTVDGTELARVDRDSSISQIAFSPDGSLLASASNEGTARLVRTADGTEAARVEHDSSISQIAFSPNGVLLATASDDRTVRLVRVVDGPEVARVDHEEPIVRIAFSPDGTLLATGSGAGMARLVRTANVEEEVARFENGNFVWQTAFSPDGHLLAMAGQNGTALLVRTFDGTEIARVEHDEGFRQIAFSPDGDLLAAASDDGTAHLVRTADGTEVARFEHDPDIGRMAFSPDGALLAASRTEAARLMQTAEGTQVTRVRHEADVLRTAFSPDGALLATASSDGTGRLVRTADGVEIARFEHDDGIQGIVFSPDGVLLATGSTDGTARLVRTVDGTELARIEDDDTVSQITFSPDGALLATGSADGTARLVRTVDGTELARIEDDDTVSHITFSPNGALLATGSADGTVRLVDTVDGIELARIEHDSGVQAVAFSPNGVLLGTATQNGTVRLFNADPEDVFYMLCEDRVGRNLSRDEWHWYLGEDIEWRPTCEQWRDAE